MDTEPEHVWFRMTYPQMIMQQVSIKEVNKIFVVELLHHSYFCENEFFFGLFGEINVFNSNFLISDNISRNEHCSRCSEKRENISYITGWGSELY